MMSKIFYWLVFFSVVTILYSCEGEDGFLKGENQIQYKSVKKLKFEDLVYSAKMKAAYGGDTLIVRLITENEGNKPIELDFTQAEMLGQNGVRSSPVVVSSEKKVLNAGESTIDTIYFCPINDMKLYKDTDLKGAFIDSYFLLPGVIGGIYFSSSSIKLIADESSYISYEELKFFDDISIYNIDNDTILKKDLLQRTTHLIELFKSANKDSLSKSKPIIPDVMISRKEVLMTGIASLVKLYERNGSITMIWRMVNHQGTPLMISPADFRLITSDGEVLKSLNMKFLERPASWKKESSRLLKGERVGIQFTFEGQNADKLIFAPSVTYDQGFKLMDKIPLVRITLPSQGQ